MRRLRTPSSTVFFLILAFPLASTPAHPQGTAWVDRFDGPVSGTDRCEELLLDVSGDVIVAGFSYVQDGSVAEPRFVTRRLTPDGSQVWSRLWNDSTSGDPAAAYAAGIHSNGDVAVAGTSGFFDWAIVRYDAVGNLRWSRVFATGSSFLPSVADLATDQAGNTWVAGLIGSGSSSLAGILRLSPFGTIDWAVLHTGVASSAYSVALAPDGAGGLYWAGEVGVPGAGLDLSLARFDAAGNLLWQVTRGTLSHDRMLDVAVTSGGDVVIAGNLEPSLGAARGDVLVARYSPDGVLLDELVYDGPDGAYDDVRGMDLGPSDEVYLAGLTVDAQGELDGHLLALTSALELDWVTSATALAGASDYLTDVHADSAGDLHVAGIALAENGNAGFTSARLTAAGLLSWTSPVGQHAADILRHGPFAVGDALRGTFLAGTTSGPPDLLTAHVVCTRLESIAPESGSLEGGELMTLRGVCFMPGAVVRVGGLPVASTFLDEETLQVVVPRPQPPAAAPGGRPQRRASFRVDVEVLNGADRTVLERAYTYGRPEAP